MVTISGSPSRQDCPTSCAVESLSMTPPGGCGGLHPLRHPDLLTDRGVTNCGGTDLTGYHLAGVQPDPQPELDTIAPIDVGGQILACVWISKAAMQARNA